MAALKQFYRIDEVPTSILVAFDRAARKVAAKADQLGISLSQAGAFCALLAAVDVDDAIIAGQALAGAYASKKKERRGFQVPPSVKEFLGAAAKRKGIKVGAVGRLVLIARADRLAETIEEGLALIRADDAAAAAEDAATTTPQEVPA